MVHQSHWCLFIGLPGSQREVFYTPSSLFLLIGDVIEPVTCMSSRRSVTGSLFSAVVLPLRPRAPSPSEGQDWHLENGDRRQPSLSASSQVTAPRLFPGLQMKGSNNHLTCVFIRWPEDCLVKWSWKVYYKGVRYQVAPFPCLYLLVLNINFQKRQ